MATKERGLTPRLNELLEEIEDLKEAREILHEIYIQRYADPNGTGYRLAEMRMHDYFGFDDSE